MKSTLEGCPIYCWTPYFHSNNSCTHQSMLNANSGMEIIDYDMTYDISSQCSSQCILIR